MCNDSSNSVQKTCIAMLSRIIVFASLAFPFTLQSAEYSMEGHLDVVNTHKMDELSENHVVVLATMDEWIVMKDTSNPTHGAEGSCSGAIEIKEGQVQGNGLCTFSDTEGDKFVISWIAKSMNEKGGPVGVWKATGGTGKYSAATGSGDYSDVPTDDPTKSVVTLSGKISI